MIKWIRSNEVHILEEKAKLMQNVPFLVGFDMENIAGLAESESRIALST